MRNTMKREYDFSKAKRGPVIRVPKGQTRITIPLDDHVLDWFRRPVDEAGGGDYQTLINAACEATFNGPRNPSRRPCGVLFGRRCAVQANRTMAR
jgi:hypothetical protein